MSQVPRLPDVWLDPGDQKKTGRFLSFGMQQTWAQEAVRIQRAKMSIVKFIQELCHRGLPVKHIEHACSGRKQNADAQKDGCKLF